MSTHITNSADSGNEDHFELLLVVSGNPHQFGPYARDLQLRISGSSCVKT